MSNAQVRALVMNWLLLQMNAKGDGQYHSSAVSVNSDLPVCGFELDMWYSSCSHAATDGSSVTTATYLEDVCRSLPERTVVKTSHQRCEQGSEHVKYVVRMID